MKFTFEIDKRGFIRSRESYNLEFKQSFQQGDNLLKYIKTLVGMANNKGGQIIFGIKDKPHIPIGLLNNNYSEIDPAKIDRLIREYFSPQINWSMDTLYFGDNKFGQLVVFESENKPIICKKNKDTIFREGAIYFRYRAETKEIDYSELRIMLDTEVQKERNLWMTHFQKVAKIGVENISLLDTYSGELSVGDKKIVIDKSILNKINFIKEGHFVESNEEGLPALKLIGTIDGIIENGIFSVDDLYPYFTKDLQDTLKVNSHEIKCLIWYFQIKGNDKYHKSIKSGKSNSIQKYSKELLYFLMDKIKDHEVLNEAKLSFRHSQQSRGKR